MNWQGLRVKINIRYMNHQCEIYVIDTIDTIRPKEEISLTASKETCWRVYTKFGVWMEVLAFFNKIQLA